MRRGCDFYAEPLARRTHGISSRLSTRRLASSADRGSAKSSPFGLNTGYARKGYSLLLPAGQATRPALDPTPTVTRICPPFRGATPRMLGGQATPSYARMCEKGPQDWDAIQRQRFLGSIPFCKCAVVFNLT